MPHILFYILLFTILNGFLAFAGAILYFVFRQNLKRILIFLVAFTTGALLGGAFFHFLPEAVEGLSLTKTIFLTITGTLIFAVTEKFLYWHHCHDGNCDKHPFTFLILCGDGIHNFIDGLIIASSFIVSIPFGIITSLLIMVHELPQEIGDFGVLIYGGLTKTKALTYNFLSQLTAVLGGITGYFFLQSEQIAVYLLPIAAGGFIYIAFADLIPEIFKEKNPKKVLVNILMIILGLVILISGKLLAG